jgi:hypothetical protein
MEEVLIAVLVWMNRRLSIAGCVPANNLAQPGQLEQLEKRNATNAIPYTIMIHPPKHNS